VRQLPEPPLLVAMRAGFCGDLSSLPSLATIFSDRPESPASLFAQVSNLYDVALLCLYSHLRGRVLVMRTTRHSS
jgi:hypothetical protein